MRGSVESRRAVKALEAAEQQHRALTPCSIELLARMLGLCVFTPHLMLNTRCVSCVSAYTHIPYANVFILLGLRPDVAVQVYTVSHHVEGSADARLDVTLNYDVSQP